MREQVYRLNFDLMEWCLLVGSASGRGRVRESKNRVGFDLEKRRHGHADQLSLSVASLVDLLEGAGGDVRGPRGGPPGRMLSSESPVTRKPLNGEKQEEIGQATMTHEAWTLLRICYDEILSHL